MIFMGVLFTPEKLFISLIILILKFFFFKQVSPGGCHSLKTRSVINVQHLSPAPPTMQNVYSAHSPSIRNFPTCSNYPATISVSSPGSGYQYNWYDAASRSNLLHTGNTYTIPNINYRYRHLVIP